MCLGRDRAASPRLAILGGSVNDHKTTFRNGIAIEGAIVRVEVPKGDCSTRKPCEKSTD